MNDIETVRQLSTLISAHKAQGSGLRVQLGTSGAGSTFVLPASVVDYLEIALQYMACGMSVEVNPLDQGLTIGEAAQRLRMPRSKLLELLDKGDIPLVRIGRHRRIMQSAIFLFEAQLGDAPPAVKDLAQRMKESGLTLVK